MLSKIWYQLLKEKDNKKYGVTNPSLNKAEFLKEKKTISV